MLASHLKPLEKKDKMGQRKNVLWNPCAAHAKAPQASDVEIPQVREMLSRPLSTSKLYSKIFLGSLLICKLFSNISTHEQALKVPGSIGAWITTGFSLGPYFVSEKSLH